jgi:hypothetical protein
MNKGWWKEFIKDGFGAIFPINFNDNNSSSFAFKYILGEEKKVTETL